MVSMLNEVHGLRHIRGAVVVLVGLFGLLMIDAFRPVWADRPSSKSTSANHSQKKSHWAFQPISRPAVPRIRATGQVRTPIDAFIVRRLEARGLSLSALADRRTLIRRATFDLLGLPPTPQQIQRFLGDKRPDAWERLIDRLLASTQYGEAWGRNWLDLVRYAETSGFNADGTRPLAYKYRDYVIRAFNNDTPYDRFVQEQIAGDEMFSDRPEALIATGYNRMWPDESNASNILLARQEALNDLTANVGSVFLGLTLGCAQCHDHKFDPLPQNDFYRLQAFFAGIVPAEKVPVGTPQQLAEYRRRLGRWMKTTEAVRRELHQIESAARAKSGRIKRRKFPAVVLKAVDTAAEKRTAYQRQLAFWSERQIIVTEKQLLAQLTPSQRQRRTVLKTQLAGYLKSRPQPPATENAMATVEIATGPPPTFLLDAGIYNRPIEKVRPGFPIILAAGTDSRATITPPPTVGSGRRTALARWLTDPHNPLPARVIVNRIWQGHFGRGLVVNGNDFGTQTPPPSHPQLLDWLASEFVANGWSIKSLHRLMMTSAVYRQASISPRVATRGLGDATQWYDRFPRRRLSAERVRDAILSLAGTLSRQMYGPGIRPKLPPKFSSRSPWPVSKSKTQRNRRSVYIFAKRNLPYPLLMAFDLPDMHESCARRAETTVAPQALMLLNSELILSASQAFADRVSRETQTTNPSPLVRRAWLLAFGREPSQSELTAAVSFLQQQQAIIVRNKKRQQKSASVIALGDFCHVLLNTNEFLYVD